MGLTCYKHNAQLVTWEVKVICAYYWKKYFETAANTRKQAGVKVQSSLVKGKSATLAANIMGISRGAVNTFQRKLKLNPCLIEDILEHQLQYANPKSSTGSRTGLYAPGWEKIKLQIQHRDGNRCAICGKFELRNPVHHVDGNKHNHSSDNLITLCYVHHGITIAHPEGELNKICKFLAVERTQKEENTDE